jgi:hypothetical protein
VDIRLATECRELWAQLEHIKLSSTLLSDHSHHLRHSNVVNLTQNYQLLIQSLANSSQVPLTTLNSQSLIDREKTIIALRLLLSRLNRKLSNISFFF